MTNEPKMQIQVCGVCGSRDPRSVYEAKELTAVGARHWVRVPKVPLKLLKAQGRTAHSAAERAGQGGQRAGQN